MATTIIQAFNEYKSNLELKDRQVSLVAQRRENVVKALKRELSLHSAESNVIGSWDRHTLTRYLSEADVDVVVLLHYSHNKHWDTDEGTTKALDRFRGILDGAYPFTEKRRDRNCITMQFSEFRFDVVPAFEIEAFPNNYYKIPDSIRQIWVETNPFEFARMISAVNANMDKDFVPLIKMVKGWNRNVGWPIRSFHLECLMYERYRFYSQSYTYPLMLVNFFEGLPGYVRSACYDPVRGERVDAYLDNLAAKTRRQVAIEKAQAAARAAREAYDDQDKYPSIAIDEWKSVFGEFFPSYG